MISFQIYVCKQNCWPNNNSANGQQKKKKREEKLRKYVANVNKVWEK